MSYGIMPYAVRQRSVESVFGSKDEDMKQNILSQVADRLAKLDESFGGTPMARIVDDFFAGEINHREEASKYRDFIEILCIGFGDILPNDRWYPACGAASHRIDDPEFKMYGVQTKPYIPSPDDFPLVNGLRHADFDAGLAAGTALQEKGEYTPEQPGQFREWISDAGSEGRDLVFYYY